MSISHKRGQELILLVPDATCDEGQVFGRTQEGDTIIGSVIAARVGNRVDFIVAARKVHVVHNLKPVVMQWTSALAF